MDIGPATVTLFGEALPNAKTIIWNGPMGAFEYDAFSGAPWPWSRRWRIPTP